MKYNQYTKILVFTFAGALCVELTQQYMHPNELHLNGNHVIEIDMTDNSAQPTEVLCSETHMFEVFSYASGTW